MKVLHNRTMSSDKIIVHIDMDAFFAAIEQRNDPKLLGKPVVVGADPKGGRGRGVVSTASYEARKFGINSAMPISVAYKRCPQAVFLLPSMDEYVKVSEDIYEILYGFSPDIEMVSIDEAFLDISNSLHLFGSSLDTAKLIKAKIKEETSLTASVGIGPNKMTAKIASDLNKPDGLVEVKKEDLLDFLWPLSIDKIWGLGPKSKQALITFGIKTIADLAKKDPQELFDIFGKNGIYFWKLANGIDEREVHTDERAKSISNEFTFEEDTAREEKIKTTLLFLCEKVSQRLRTEGLKARTITLKIRLQDFSTSMRSVTLCRATNFVDTIYKEIKNIYTSFDKRKKKVRLLGVKVSNFIDGDFPDTIFCSEADRKLENIHKAVDRIKEKFGDTSIGRGLDRLS